MLADTRELMSYRTLVLNLTARELKSEYKKSLLGNFWALLNPALTLSVYSLVFGVFLNFARTVPPAHNPDVQSYPLFLFCGLIMWSLFNRVAVGAMAAFTETGSLLKKVYFPAAAPVVAHSIAALRQTALEGGLVVAVLLALGSISPWVLLWPLALVPLLAFATGLGLLLSLMNSYYRDTGYLTSIGMMLLFYLTPIIYPLERVAGTEFMGIPAQTLLKLNPLTHFAGISRSLLYTGEMPPASSMAAALLAGGVTLLVGWGVFVRYSKDISEAL